MASDSSPTCGVSRARLHPISSARPQRSRLHAALVSLLLGLVSFATPAAAISVIPPTFEELVEGAGEIVRARVVGKEAFRTTSPDGTAIIKTRVTWEVISDLKGETAPEQLSLEFLGGRVGEDEIRVGGMPEFKIGEEDFLFVEPDTRVFCPLYAAGHGRYRVLKESKTGRAYIARDNGAPLVNVSQVAAPLGQVLAPMAAQAGNALTPEAFEEAIRSTLDGKPLEETK